MIYVTLTTLFPPQEKVTMHYFTTSESLYIPTWSPQSLLQIDIFQHAVMIVDMCVVNLFFNGYC